MNDVCVPLVHRARAFVNDDELGRDRDLWKVLQRLPLNVAKPRSTRLLGQAEGPLAVL